MRPRLGRLEVELAGWVSILNISCPIFLRPETVKFNALFSSSNPPCTICCSLHLWWTTITHHTTHHLLRGLILKIEMFGFLWPWDVWDYVVMFFCHIPMTGWHFHLHRISHLARHLEIGSQQTTHWLLSSRLQRENENFVAWMDGDQSLCVTWLFVSHWNIDVNLLFTILSID